MVGNDAPGRHDRGNDRHEGISSHRRLINRDGADISVWSNGGFDELLRRIESEWAKAPLK